MTEPSSRLQRAARLASKRPRFRGAMPKAARPGRPSLRSQDDREPEAILLEAVAGRLARAEISVVFHRSLRPRPDAPASVQRGLIVVFCNTADRCWRRPLFADLLDQATDRRELGALLDREIRWSMLGQPAPRGPIPDDADGDPDTSAVDRDICAGLQRVVARQETR